MPMNLYVPEIGDILELEQSWTFQLYKESRNKFLIDLLALGPNPPGRREAKAHVDRCEQVYDEQRHLSKYDEVYYEARHAYLQARDDLDRLSWTVTLPATTKVKVARIYIRVGASDFSSLTFTIVETPLMPPFGKKLQGRAGFWAKLADVNKMQIKRPEGR